MWKKTLYTVYSLKINIYVKCVAIKEISYADYNQLFKLTINNKILQV